MVDYIEKINISNHETFTYKSECFCGHWVPKYLLLCHAQTFQPDSWTKWSLEDYLPNDGFDYEVLMFLLIIAHLLNILHNPGGLEVVILIGWVLELVELQLTQLQQKIVQAWQ